jgi:hypothetical protein
MTPVVMVAMVAVVAMVHAILNDFACPLDTSVIFLVNSVCEGFEQCHTEHTTLSKREKPIDGRSYFVFLLYLI